MKNICWHEMQMYCGLKTKTSLRPIFMESNQDQLHVREKQDCIFGGKFEKKKNGSVFHFSPSSLPVLHLHFHFRLLAFTTDLNVMCWGLSPLASGTWLTFGDGWWWFFLFFKLQYCFSFSWSWFAALTCCLTAESTLMRHKWKSLNSNLNS